MAESKRSCYDNRKYHDDGSKQKDSPDFSHQLIPLRRIQVNSKQFSCPQTGITIGLIHNGFS
jgi:hypothetical protein